MPGAGVQHLALLRGINVGGKNAVAMAELREAFERPGLDDIATHIDSVIYFSRLTAKATSSRMNRVVGTPEYQDMTIRSWSTTTKLLALMDERAASSS